MTQDVSNIPLVDLSRWFGATDEDRAALATEVDDCLQRLGFLVVINHGIDRDVLSACRTAALEFFHGPDDIKEAIAFDGGAYRGWIGAGMESNAATYGVDTPPDLKETFGFGPVELEDESLRERNPSWYAPNKWPAAPAALRPAAEAHWRACKELADELLQLFAVALRLPSETLLDFCRSGTSSTNLNWYWPHSHIAPDDGQFRIGPHTDFGTITILDREPGVGGLQVQNDAGDWIDAPVVEDSLIVNTGDLLRQWTNDRWASNEHRVLPPSAGAPNEELLSLVFFHEPDADAMIAPLETCVSDDNPSRYEPISSADYLAEKFAALDVSTA